MLNCAQCSSAENSVFPLFKVIMLQSQLEMKKASIWASGQRLCGGVITFNEYSFSAPIPPHFSNKCTFCSTSQSFEALQNKSSSSLLTVLGFNTFSSAKGVTTLVSQFPQWFTFTPFDYYLRIIICTHFKTHSFTLILISLISCQ